ncbi:MAG: hypothetical protein KIT84_42595 [Labilithrix sp.]|nr:hypothetical protein [Labilithrix sp.]MCW5817767.1 hypothetical protein [Labilithrix sp.]
MRFAAATLLLLSGCAIVAPMSPAARAQEAATELNINSRFGRMELATERVAPSHRDAWLVRHRAWGGAIRVADYEMAGFKMKGDNDAESLVRVAWYRVDQGDLHNTLLRQSWHQTKGAWQLVDETHSDGDVGLLGEPVPAPLPLPSEAPPGQKKAAQFPTIRLGSTENAPASAD